MNVQERMRELEEQDKQLREQENAVQLQLATLRERQIKLGKLRAQVQTEISALRIKNAPDVDEAVVYKYFMMLLNHDFESAVSEIQNMYCFNEFVKRGDGLYSLINGWVFVVEKGKIVDLYHSHSRGKV